MKKFDEWNEIKKEADYDDKVVGFRNRDIFYMKTGENNGKFYYKFSFVKRNNEEMTNIALLSQMKLYSSKRLLNQIGTINKDDFEKLKVSFKCLLD